MACACGRHIEHLVFDHAAVGRRGDVAHAVGARSHGGHPCFGEHGCDIDRVFELEVVDLDVLANGDVCAPAPPARGDLGDGVELIGRDHPSGDLDPQHVLHVRKLRVETHAETKRPKLIGGQLSGAVAGDVGGQIA